MVALIGVYLVILELEPDHELERPLEPLEPPLLPPLRPPPLAASDDSSNTTVMKRRGSTVDSRIVIYDAKPSSVLFSTICSSLVIWHILMNARCDVYPRGAADVTHELC